MSAQGVKPVGLFRRLDADALKADFRVYLLKELDRAEATANNYLNGLAVLERHSGKPITDIGPSELRAFKRSDFGQAYKQMVVVSARAWHAWGALEGHWERNGIMDVVTPRTPMNPKPPLSPQTARTLLEAARIPNEIRVAYLGLYAGLRISESTSIDEHSWLTDRLTFIGKGRKKRSVPVHPELAKVKGIILSEQPASVGVLQSTLARLRDRVEATDPEHRPATSHSLRRTFASRLYAQGVGYEVVARLLGHGKKDVTSLYVQVGWERHTDAIRTLDYYSGEPQQLALF